ncbi:MAG: hypothetical protein WCO94_05885 [Verrucomicrobiota bacterium]
MTDRIFTLAPLFLGAVGELVMPDPTGAGSVGWLVICLAGGMVMLKTGLDLWKDHFREAPRPADTYVAKTDFKETVQEFTARLESAVEKIEQFSSDNYKARRMIHKKINGQQNALNYLAGTLSRDGRSHEAKHIQALIKEDEYDGDED